MSVTLETVGISRNENILKIANVNPVYAMENEKISAVADKIISKKHRRIPIVNHNEELVGIVTTMDILDAFLRKVNFNDKISEIMSRDVVSASSEDNINSVLQRMKMSRRGGFPIIRLKHLVAMIGERDFIRNFSQVEFNKKVSELMVRKPFFVKGKMSILDCLKSMVNVCYRRLPVVDGSRLVGLVTASDMLNFIAGNNFTDADINKEITLISIKKPIMIGKDEDISAAIKTMVQHDIGGLVVVGDNDKLEGIITERDILEEII